MTALRLGFVGCGAITAHHLPALRGLPGVALAAAADLDLDRASAMARKFGIPRVCRDPYELLGHVDAILLATPNATHAQIATEFLAQGVHVLCEKPVTTSAEKLDRMLAAARSGARLMGAHSMRFLPNMAMLRRVVASGWLGHLESVSGGHGGPYEEGGQRTDFRRNPQLSGGGVLIDVGVHFLDLTVWLAGGAPESVEYRATLAPGWSVETDAEVALVFPDGARASLAFSYSRALENALTVRGRWGWVRASLGQPLQLTVFSERAAVCRRDGAQELVLPHVNMYRAQAEHFVNALRTGEEFLIRPEEMRATLGIVDACYRTQPVVTA